MNSKRIQFASRMLWVSLGLMAVLVATGACQKKCQAPAASNFKTITGQDWRLVQTTDPTPAFKQLTTTNFLIFNFAVTYNGTVTRVENNKRYPNPALIFEYDVDRNKGELRVVYKEPAAEGSNTTQDDSGDLVDYDYKLGKELELRDSAKGYYYRFVPFSTVVAPDDTCEF